MTIVLAVVGDTHCGSTTGLCPPIYELTERGHQQANVAQRWLWRCWVGYWRRVSELVDGLGAELWVVLNGDLIEGFHHSTTQIVTVRPDDMQRLAVATLEPYVRPAERVFVVKGTEAHIGAGGLWDDLVARDLGAVPDEANQSPAWHWLPIEVEGLHVAFAHHGKGSSREHLRGNAARAISADLSAYYWESYGMPPPSMAVFGHVHCFQDSGSVRKPRVWTHGCWQLSTGFGSKIRPGR